MMKATPVFWSTSFECLPLLAYATRRNAVPCYLVPHGTANTPASCGDTTGVLAQQACTAHQRGLSRPGAGGAEKAESATGGATCDAARNRLGAGDALVDYRIRVIGHPARDSSFSGRRSGSPRPPADLSRGNNNTSRVTRIDAEQLGADTERRRRCRTGRRRGRRGRVGEGVRVGAGLDHPAVLAGPGSTCTGAATLARACCGVFVCVCVCARARVVCVCLRERRGARRTSAGRSSAAAGGGRRAYGQAEPPLPRACTPSFESRSKASWTDSGLGPGSLGA